MVVRIPLYVSKTSFEGHVVGKKYGESATKMPILE